jgi:hypothetical protein
MVDQQQLGTYTASDKHPAVFHEVGHALLLLVRPKNLASSLHK